MSSTQQKRLYDASRYAANQELYRHRAAIRYWNNRPACLQYVKRYQALHRLRIQAYRKSYRRKNRNHLSILGHCYRLSRADTLRANQRLYYRNHRQLILQKVKNYRERNRNKINQRLLQRYYQDIHFRLRVTLRNRIRLAVKLGLNAGSIICDLGCSIEELKSHLEKQFRPGMTWKNYGKWHLDHIRPLASFDLTDRTQFLQACHYTNLQPLWAIDNFRKGHALIPPSATRP